MLCQPVPSRVHQLLHLWLYALKHHKPDPASKQVQIHQSLECFFVSSSNVVALMEEQYFFGSFHKIPQHILIMLHPQRWQCLGRYLFFKYLLVIIMQLPRIVIRNVLGAHIVDCNVKSHVFLRTKGWLP